MVIEAAYKKLAFNGHPVTQWSSFNFIVALKTYLYRVSQLTESTSQIRNPKFEFKTIDTVVQCLLLTGICENIFL